MKGILDKLFSPAPKITKHEVKSISHAEVEALVEAKFREHAATIEKTVTQQVTANQSPIDKEDYSLTPKQIEFALSLIEKTREYELAADAAKLTVKDLNKLIAFNRYKNKGILVNLVKKGVLRNKKLF
ncbi:ABC transporter ATP-binding protein [Bacillus sp. UNC438CL73TsuS30]|uniref:ABC transporter ATP-binding protein n=1 Tax=Bacillus sp. UNC438CL73TsuS30 TaxID=1340434 RepID=UPI001E50C9A3|nr:ABC transporter ATP-binding protein [Bacillus sp. UNC438CL73TsuS30]